MRFAVGLKCLAEGFHCLSAPRRAGASSRERKEKTAYKKRCGSGTFLELCPLDPMMIGLEFVSTSTLSITSQDVINHTSPLIKTFLTTTQTQQITAGTNSVYITHTGLVKVLN